MEFSRQEYWSGLPFLIQGIFPTEGLNPGLPYCRQILYRLSHQCRFSCNKCTTFLGNVDVEEAMIVWGQEEYRGNLSTFCSILLRPKIAFFLKCIFKKVSLDFRFCEISVLIFMCVFLIVLHCTCTPVTFVSPQKVQHISTLYFLFLLLFSPLHFLTLNMPHISFTYFVNCLSLLLPLPHTIECKLHEGKDTCLFCPLLYALCPNTFPINI